MKKEVKYLELDSGDNTIGNLSHPGKISSGGLGPCIAIGLWNKKNKKIYMLHETMHIETKVLPDL